MTKSPHKILGACKVNMMALLKKLTIEDQANTKGHVKMKVETNTGGMLGHYENQ